jgi:hypothetical protein
MTTNRLERITSYDDRWNEAVHGVLIYGWGWNTQVDYWGVRIADAVVVGRTNLDRVSQQLSDASTLYREALEISEEVGGLDSLGTDDWAEALVRAMAYQSLRSGKNRVRTDNHRKHHLAAYQGRVSLLHSGANIGLGRLERRDLGLDDLWYDKEEL